MLESDVTKGIYIDGVLQLCFCGQPLPANGDLHPRCRQIVKDGLKKIYDDVLTEALTIEFPKLGSEKESP